ncbi:MAG: N-acetyltransferase [Planctomycetota bacterium]|nr:MAG: N-acetyltransferase [Planctomycetota bacterium]
MRHVLTDDAPGLLLIYAPIVEASHITFEYVVPSEAEMRMRIEKGSKKYPWLAAVDDDGTLIGYAYACSWRERQAYQWAVEVSVYTHPDHQRRGVAQRLYAKLFQQLKTQGFVVAYGAITLPNSASVAFHKAMGFRQVGNFETCGFKLGAWHDVEFWGLPLGECDENPTPPHTPSLKSTS